MAFNAKYLKPLDWVVLATGLVSLVALFLPWWGVSFGGVSISVNGWHTSWGWFGGLVVVAGAAWYVLARSGASMPPLPITTVVAGLGSSLFGLVIILLRWLTLPRGDAFGRAFSYGGRAGIWIAALAAAVQVAALFVVFRRSGEQLPWKTRRGGSAY